MKGEVMAGEETLRGKCGGWRQVCGERRFGILLVTLIVLLAGSPVLLEVGLSPGWFDGLMSLVMLAAILSLCFDRRQRMFALLLGIPTIFFCLGGYAFQERPIFGSCFSATCAESCFSLVRQR